jgi:prepilin-type N-terminal cleavage/methylation domain-containing protein
VKMYKKSAFTLVELLIVVVLVGILTTFAMPGFIEMQKKAKDRDARTQLKRIQEAEKTYRLRNGAYIECSTTSGCSTDLGLDLSDQCWDYAVSVDDTASPPTFSVTAAGGEGTDQWQIDQDDECAWGSDNNTFQEECEVN